MGLRESWDHGWLGKLTVWFLAAVVVFTVLSLLLDDNPGGGSGDYTFRKCAERHRDLPNDSIIAICE